MAFTGAPLESFRNADDANKVFADFEEWLDENDVVLLSDFDYWHFVLNDLPISEDGKEECAFSKDEKEKSWQKIFDVDFNSDENYSIQAVLWEIKQEWVKSVDFLEL